MKIHKINFLILIIAQSILLSCNEKSNCDKIPFIIIENNQDTIRAGEQYSANMYLSDSCFFFIEETNSYIFPIMIVNDERVKVNKNKTTNVLFYVKKDSTQEQKYTDAHWIGEIIFPHSKVGDIHLTRRVDYVVENF